MNTADKRFLTMFLSCFLAGALFGYPGIGLGIGFILGVMAAFVALATKQAPPAKPTFVAESRITVSAVPTGKQARAIFDDGSVVYGELIQDRQLVA